MKSQRIVAVHLLNDFSGSPFVLSQSLATLASAGYQLELFTATPGGKGFLSDIAGVKEYGLFYKWNKSKLVTLFLFIRSQLSLFIRLFFHLKKSDIVYINSILPFGAALAAGLRGSKVFYHIHEVSVKPALLKKFLLTVANSTADKAIFVSNDLKERTIFSAPSSVVYNALPEAFISTAIQSARKKTGNKFTVLMLCSLKEYKGVLEFIACARQLSNLQFNLVLNSTEPEINQFFAAVKLPKNLQLFPSQKYVHPFYQEADVVMNLSKPDQWIETFGMTILEAMYYKKPVIVPPVGGVAELISAGKEGYLIDSRDITAVCEKLELMYNSSALYHQLSANAFLKAQQFSQHEFAQNIQCNIASLAGQNAENSIPEKGKLYLNATTSIQK